MKVWKIAVLNRVTLTLEPFAFDFPAEVAEYPSTQPEETTARITGADVVVTDKTVITAEHIAVNPQLRLTAVAATGVNNVNVAAVKAAGVTVCNTHVYGNESVAEHTFMLMIVLMHNLPAYQRDIAAGIWEQSPFFCHSGTPMHDLHGKMLAVSGRGNVGKTLTSYACALGMNVVFGEHKHTENAHEGYISPDEAIQTADAVSLHCPLILQTANMTGEAELQHVRPGAVLINYGHDDLVDEQALVATLKYGQIGGAGFDILTEEPPRNGNPLLKARLPNLIVTPYMAWDGEEARNRLFAILLKNINRFVAGWPQNVVV